VDEDEDDSEEEEEGSDRTRVPVKLMMGQFGSGKEGMEERSLKSSLKILRLERVVMV